jgi:hypothetical protein
MRRYQTLRDLKVGIAGVYRPTAGNLSWEEAREETSRLLKGTSAEGAASTVKSSYELVRNDLQAGRSGEYFMLKDWRYRHNGEPDPRGPTKLPQSKD